MKTSSTTIRTVLSLLIVYSLSCSSCFSYRVATKAQGATDNTLPRRVKGHSLLWGLLNNPQVIPAHNCDSLNSLGVSEVTVKATFGNALVTILTLGIYCPVRIEYKCAKPCPVEGQM